MDELLEFHEILCEIMNITEPDGDSHVYFDPPESKKMKYPAIRYSRKKIDNHHANNALYKQNKAYEVIVIDGNPDSPYVEAVSKLPYCSFDRHYKANSLNHDVFTIYHN